MSTETELVEVLVVVQGFEYKIGNFTMDDFRGDKLPNFSDPENLNYRKYYRIEKHGPKVHCPWGRSRWVTGKEGKLIKLDDDYDTSG